jgi:hypothetical protein
MPTESEASLKSVLLCPSLPAPQLAPAQQPHNSSVVQPAGCCGCSALRAALTRARRGRAIERGVEQEEGARCLARDRRLGNGRRDSGQAPGRASAHAEHAKHATRDRVVRVASGTQRGRHARAQAQAHFKQGEGKGDTAREAGSVEFG